MSDFFNFLAGVVSGTGRDGDYLNFFGGHMHILVLTALIAIDIITGFAAAVYKKEVSSQTSFFGMAKKTFLLFLVATGYLVQFYHPEVPITQGICYLFSVTEALSIVENLKKMGLPIPAAFDVFAQKSRDLLDKQIMELFSRALGAFVQAAQSFITPSATATAGSKPDQPTTTATATINKESTTVYDTDKQRDY